MGIFSNYNLYALLFMLVPNMVFSQDACYETIVESNKIKGLDTLGAKATFYFKNKKISDFPFVEEYRFTKEKNEANYFVLYKNSQESTIKYHVEYGKSGGATITIENKPKYIFFAIDKTYEGLYKVITYSKKPDNSCVVLSKLYSKSDLSDKLITTPEIKAFLNPVTSIEKRELIKQYNIEVPSDSPLPVYEQFSHVLTKKMWFYFKLEGNKNLKFKLLNKMKEEVPLKRSPEDNDLFYIEKPPTGVYFLVVYQHNPVAQEVKLNLYRSF